MFGFDGLTKIFQQFFPKDEGTEDPFGFNRMPGVNNDQDDDNDNENKEGCIEGCLSQLMRLGLPGCGCLIVVLIGFMTLQLVGDLSGSGDIPSITNSEPLKDDPEDE